MRIRSHFSAEVAPATSAVVAIAPAFTIGFIGLPSLSSMAITELNGRPVLFTPTRWCTSSWPISSATRANTKAFEIDWIENGTSASPMLCSSPSTSARASPNSSGSTCASTGM